MKSHTLPAQRHADDDDCPEMAEPIMEIIGSGGVTVTVPWVVNDDETRVTSESLRIHEGEGKR